MSDQNNTQIGAIISGGVSDWQIFQQDESGHAAISVHGRWQRGDEGAKPRVQLRIVHGDTGLAVNAALDWQDAKTAPDNTWKATLKNVPAGGLYRLETRSVAHGQAATAWADRGDMRHFIGVGDLWVIAGQSNSAGYGRGPVFDPPQLGVHIFRNSEQWALAAQPLNESTDTAHIVNREAANSGHAPWLHWAKLVQNAVNHPIGLIQTSLGGSPLVSWNPTEPGEHGLFENMRHCVELVGGKAKGVLWYQGESDAGSEETSTTYSSRFTKAVGAWSKALKNPNLAVVTVQLNRYYGETNDEANYRWTYFRDVQRRIAQTLENVVVVPTLDLPLSDAIHVSPDGNMLLADRAARAALGAFYGKDSFWQAPDIQSARKIGKQTLELTFANVATHLMTIAESAKPFRVDDESGEVPVESWTSTDHRVRLNLGRPLQGRALVHAGYGTNPPILPHDEPRLMPILAFYGVEVQ